MLRVNRIIVTIPITKVIIPETRVLLNPSERLKLFFVGKQPLGTTISSSTGLIHILSMSLSTIDMKLLYWNAVCTSLQTLALREFDQKSSGSHPFVFVVSSSAIVFSSITGKGPLIAHLASPFRTIFIMSGSFQGPLSEFMQPPLSAHVHVPPKNSGSSLASMTSSSLL
uniref:Uncharacterized protein n=1 Tax=Opuntia streptacantha TaxID=393608 RepID=A0A7C8ZUE5_OPUST